MDNKKKNEIVALSIVIIVSLVGFALIFWFYSVITPVQNKVSGTGAININNEILDKVTTGNNSAPLQLEDNDFGRTNPFDNFK